MNKCHRQFQALLDAMSQGAFLQNADGSLCDVNPAALELFGLGRDEFLGRTSLNPEWRVITEDGRPMPPEEHPSMRALHTGQPQRNVIAGVFNCQQHRFVWMEINAVPLFNEGEVKPFQVFVTLHDISERKRLNDVNSIRLHLMEFSSVHSVDELLVETLDKLEEFSGSSVGCYHFFDAESHRVILKEWSTRTVQEFCCAGEKGDYCRIDQTGTWADLFHSGKPYIQNNWQNILPWPGLASGPALILRELVVPVIRNGTIVAILGIGNKHTDYDQHDVELVSLFADLAWGFVERKRFDAMLRYQNEITKNMSEGVTLIRSDNGSIVFTNQKFDEMFGYSPGELIGKNVAMLNAPSTATPEEIRNSIIETLARTGEWQGEIENIKKDGTHFWCHASVSCFDSNDHGRVFLGVHTDITERKQAVASLLSSERRFKSLIKKSSDSITILDKDGTQIFVSDVVESMLGYAPSELINIPVIDEMIHPDDQEATRAAFVKILEEGEVVAHYRHRHKNGSWVHLEGWGTNQLENPDIRGIVVNVRDITERIKMESEKMALENQLHQAQRLESLGVLAGGIAHDFNNILAVIMGRCSLAQLNYEKAGDHIPTILQASERAAGLCRQMLVYAGKSQGVQTNVDVGILVADAVAMLQSTLPQHIVITFEKPTDSLGINADSSLITQVAMNLIINASEAIGVAHGEISVAVTKQLIADGQSEKDYLGKIIPSGWYACLDVSDNGCGMSAETYNRIFEPFYSTKFAGRGLGMSAVLGIVNSINGSLQIFSQSDHGSTFRIFLPLQVNQIPESVSTYEKIPPVRTFSGSVLLVDDDELVLMVANSMLETLGFTVVEAVNGKAALDKYQEKSSEIVMVLTDIGMPVMSGYELIRELKKMNPELPIIISSGFGDDDIASQVSHDDIAGLISKPYSYDRMFAVISNVLV